jgi:hypothetical protein
VSWAVSTSMVVLLAAYRKIFIMLFALSAARS